MKYVRNGKYELSLFQLGTVQLGMNYGITGETKKPSREYAYSMLDRAIELGVNSLDTANNYADSERVIGEWLRRTPREKWPAIITKIGPFKHEDKDALRRDIRSEVRECLRILGVDSIDILMLHNFSDYAASPDIIMEEFRRFKDEGIAKTIAISVYSYEDYFAVAKSGFEAVQLPINIFDHTRIIDGGLKAIADAGMMIFARSVFLQGLVFIDPDELDPRMKFAEEPLRRFRALCEEFGMEPSTLAASFVLSLPGITSLVLGCQRIPQIEENAKMLDKARILTDEEMKKIKLAFEKIDERVINPKLWYNNW